MKFDTQFHLVINQNTYKLEVTRIKMIRHLLILSMVCALGHSLSCPPCNDPMYPVTCDEPKCCTSGELTPDVCPCCLTCAKGKIIYSLQYKHKIYSMASTINFCCFCLLILTLKVKPAMYRNFIFHFVFLMKTGKNCIKIQDTLAKLQTLTFNNYMDCNFHPCLTSSCPYSC